MPLTLSEYSRLLLFPEMLRQVYGFDAYRRSAGNHLLPLQGGNGIKTSNNQAANSDKALRSSEL